MYTQEAHVSRFLLSNTHRDHHHISIPLESLTGRQPLISLSHVHLHIYHFWLTRHMYILLFSLIYAETIQPPSPGLSTQMSSSTHFCHTSLQVL